MEMAEKETPKPEKMSSGNRAVYFNGLSEHLEVVTWKILDCKDIHLE